MARFSVVGLASPHLPSRIVNHFAQRDLTIDWLTLERRGEWYEVVLEQAGMDMATAALIAEKLRAMIEVSDVVLDTGGTAANLPQPPVTAHSSR